MKIYKLLFLILCLGMLSPAGMSSLYAQCPTGTDIHIANDVSGSVDSREFQQSKDFVSLLGANFGSAYGTGNTETRVSISNWSAGSGRFVEYNFPSAGQNYATSIGDILSYTTSARPFRGGTDVYTALLRAREWVNQSPLFGRTVPKVIVLLTDANCRQVANNTSSLATQIKNQGVIIVVLAIDNAASCTNLSGTNVASPGGYFNAADYATLSSQAITYINSLRDATCDDINPQPPAPFELSVSLSNFTIINCNTTPSASADFLVTNNSSGDDFSDNLQVSFYNGDPTNPSTQYLFTESFGSQTIASGGGTYSNSVNNTALTSTSTLYAVVNYDGAAAGNAVPLSFSDLANEVAVTGEGLVNNNISSPVSRTDGTGCLPFANIDTRVTNSGVGCDDEVIYTVEVCNTGTADAVIGSTDLTTYAPTGALELSETLINDGFTLETTGSTFGQLGNNILQDITYGPAIAPRGKSRLSGDGQTVAVAFPDDLSNDNSKIVRILDFNGTNWVQRGNDIDTFNNNLDPDLVEADDINITPDGNTVVIGSHDLPGNTNIPGFVSVYDWNGSAWVQRGNNIVASNTGTEFGASVDISEDGNTLAVGAEGGNPSSGFARIFDWSGSAWIQRGSDIVGDPASDFFNAGVYVKLSGDGNLLVNAGLTSVGGLKVRFWDWTGSAWVQRAGEFSGINQLFSRGENIDMTPDGNTFLIYGINGGNFGSIGIFDWNGTSWITRQIIPEPANRDFSWGNSIGVSADGNRFITSDIGFNGIFGTPTDSFVDIYEWNGSAYTLQTTYGPESVIELGVTVDMSDDGSTYVFSDGTTPRDGVVVYGTEKLQILPAGACSTFEYTYDVSGLNAGTYDYSAGVVATAKAGDDPVTFSPNTGFSAGGDTGLNGFDGSVQSTDNLTYSGTTVPCTTTGDQISVAVTLADDPNFCAGDFSTATVTITNTSGLSLSNALLNLDLSGTDATFNGEPFNLTNGLVLAEPNIFDPAYPAVPNALSGTAGVQSLDIFTLPDNTSTFEIDVIVGSPTTALAVDVSQLPTSVNASGVTNTASDNVSVGIQPEITFTCPASATATDTTISIPFTATGAASVTWRSGSDGTFVGGSPQVYNINDIDRANGFVEISAEAQSADSCLALASCRIEITGSVYDFGDAPLSYDFGEILLPTAAASTRHSDIYLGSLAPDSESASTPTANATGDGVEEDGLNTAVIPDVKPGQTYTLTVTATNNDTTRPAYLRAFIDWNTDGDFLGDEGEVSQEVIVPANSGNSSYPVEFTVPANVSSNLSDVIVRLRLSTDEFAAARTFGASANGEVEDFQIQPNVCLPLNLKVYLAGALIDNGGATGSGSEPLMRDNLRNSIFEASTSYLPTLEPYTALAGFTHVGSGGGEEATATTFDDRGQNSVVDWVFVEFRDKNDNTTVLETMSALVQRDGDVVDIDGVSPILLCTTEVEYFVAVRHRNHFGVMTALAENLRTDSTVDFSDNNAGGSGVFNYGTSHPIGGPAGFDYTGLSQQSSYLFTPFPSGISALWLGNAVVGNKIKYESPNDDNSQIFEDVLLFPGNSSFLDNYDFAFSYVSGDLDMNGKVKYEAPNDDQNILAEQILSYPLNLSFVFNFDFLFEQLP